MNEPQQSNQTGVSGTFPSQSAPQTNPFTADLKGEFTSNFGTNTNAVSQIFKEGNFASQNRNKYLIIGGVLVVVLAVVFYILTMDDGYEEDFAADETVAEDTEGALEEGEEAESDAAVASEEGVAEGEEAVGEEASGEEATVGAEESATDAMAESSAMPEQSAPMEGGPISLMEPGDGANVNYDETQGPAMFSWSGGGGYIVFSRSSSMQPEIMRVPVSGNSYSFHHPYPGTWYWKVSNSSGDTDVRSFTVNPPVRRNVQVSEPATGGTVAGTGGVVSWQGDNAVAFYRVELSGDGAWTAPSRFATSGNSVQLQGVAAGQYQLRVGAFSEVAGRWEYTQPISVSVQ